MKQAIVVREDLKLSRGKEATQIAHAAVTLALIVKEKNKEWFNRWVKFGQKKIILKVKNLKELKEIKKRADKLKIPNKIIRDAGLTEVKPGTITAIGIGPAPDKIINKVIGSLPLL